VGAQLDNLSGVAYNQGDYAAAAALLYLESLALMRQLGDQVSIMSALVGLAKVAQARSQPELAARLLPIHPLPDGLATCPGHS